MSRSKSRSVVRSRAPVTAAVAAIQTSILPERLADLFAVGVDRGISANDGWIVDSLGLEEAQEEFHLVQLLGSPVSLEGKRAHSPSVITEMSGPGVTVNS